VPEQLSLSYDHHEEAWKKMENYSELQTIRKKAIYMQTDTRKKAACIKK